MKEAYAAGQKPNIARDKIDKVLEIQKTLQELTANGVRVTYHCCDVGNRAALAAVLDRVRHADGPIAGIIHGAGVEHTGRFEHKTPAMVLATISPKINGTMALMELTRGDPLRYFIAFGSLSGRFGGAGQTDYAMANDMIAKQVNWFRRQRPDCLSVTFHWPGWAEVGMASRSESRTALKGIGHTFLAPSQGVSILLSELACGGPVGEVVVVDQNELPSEILYRS
jgi:NAD(P)-dependent dehydrogenase (short-subunit alcohol dehydrogenase family)